MRWRYAHSTVEVRSRYGRGMLLVRSRYTPSTVEVRSWCGRSTLVERSRYAHGMLTASGTVRHFHFLSGGTVFLKNTNIAKTVTECDTAGTIPTIFTPAVYLICKRWIFT